MNKLAKSGILINIAMSVGFFIFFIIFFAGEKITKVTIEQLKTNFEIYSVLLLDEKFGIIYVIFLLAYILAIIVISILAFFVKSKNFLTLTGIAALLAPFFLWHFMFVFFLFQKIQSNKENLNLDIFKELSMINFFTFLTLISYVVAGTFILTGKGK